MGDESFSVIIWLGLCLIIGALATNKNRSFWAFFILSAILSPIIGGLVLLFIKKKTPERIEVVFKPSPSDFEYEEYEREKTTSPSDNEYEEAETTTFSKDSKNEKEETSSPPSDSEYEEENIVSPHSCSDDKNEKNTIHRTVIVLVCIVFIIIIGCIVLISESDNENDREDLNYGSILTIEQGENEDAQNVLIEGLNFDVKSMKFARHYGNLKYMEMADEGLVNCVVYVDINNATKRSITLTDYDAVLTCDGVEYNQMICEDIEFLFHKQIILSEESLSKKVIDFQIPKEQQYSDSEILLTICSTSGKQMTWKLR